MWGVSAPVFGKDPPIGDNWLGATCGQLLLITELHNSGQTRLPPVGIGAPSHLQQEYLNGPLPCFVNGSGVASTGRNGIPSG